MGNMLDFIRDWGGFVPLLVLVWVALAYGVAWWRTRRGFFGVQALINGMWAIFFFFQQASSNRSRTSLFFILVVVIGAMAVPFFERKSGFKPYRSGRDVLFFRHPQTDAPNTMPNKSSASQLAIGLILLVGTPLVAGTVYTLQPCHWLDRVTGNSGCVAAFDNDSAIFSVVYTPDSRSLIGTKSPHHPGPIVELWDSESGQRTILVRDSGEEYPYAALSPDGQTLALELNERQVVQFRNLATGAVIRTVALSSSLNTVHSIGFSSDGQSLFVPTPFGAVLIRPSDGTIIQRIRQPQPFAIAPDHRSIVVRVAQELQIQSVVDGAVLRSFPIAANGALYRLHFSADGAVLAAMNDEFMSIWQINDGTLTTIPITTMAVDAIALSPTGDRIVGTSSRRTDTDQPHLRLWRVADGQLLQERSLGEYASNDQVIFAPNGATIAYDNGLSTIQVWRVPSP